MQVWLGIDAGGSKSILLAVDKNENIIYKDKGASIHARMMPVEDQVAGVTQLIKKLQKDQPELEIMGLGIGIAGGGREKEQTALRTALEVVYPNFPTLVTSDAHIAHAEAFKDGQGILIITGTGSMVLGRLGDKWDRAGGYGFIIGDPAGGYRLGQEALFAICTAFDGGKPTKMTPLLKERLNIATREELIIKIYDNSVLPAQIAPILLDAAGEGDEVAQKIVQDNCGKLAVQVALASQSLGFTKTPISVIGGLFNNEYFNSALKSNISSVLDGVIWADAVKEPALGGCRLLWEKVAPVN